MLPMTNPQLHKDYWANIVLSAESVQEPFEEVRVITLRSFFLDTVYQQAIDELMDEGHGWDEASIKQRARHIISTHAPVVSERVLFASGVITVVIDTPLITDDTVFNVMAMLSKALDAPGQDTVIVGPPTVFSQAILD